MWQGLLLVVGATFYHSFCCLWERNVIIHQRSLRRSVAILWGLPLWPLGGSLLFNEEINHLSLPHILQKKSAFCTPTFFLKIKISNTHSTHTLTKAKVGCKGQVTLLFIFCFGRIENISTLSKTAVILKSRTELHGKTCFWYTVPRAPINVDAMWAEPCCQLEQLQWTQSRLFSSVHKKCSLNECWDSGSSDERVNSIYAPEVDFQDSWNWPTQAALTNAYTRRLREQRFILHNSSVPKVQDQGVHKVSCWWELSYWLKIAVFALCPHMMEREFWCLFLFS